MGAFGWLYPGAYSSASVLSFAPAVGTVALAGQAALVALAISPASGNLSLSGQSPVSSYGSFLPVPTGATAISGQSAALVFIYAPLPWGTNTVPYGTTTRFYQTVLTSPTTYTIPVGSLAVTGQGEDPIVTIIVAPDVGACSFTGQSPVWFFGVSISELTGATSVSGQTPSLVFAFRIAVPTGSITCASLALTVDIVWPPITVLVNSVYRTMNVRVLNTPVKISDELDESPNFATLRCFGFTPAVGEEIEIRRTGQLEFAGHLVTVTQIYESVRANVAFDVRAQDYTWALSKMLVNKRYTNQSATDIIVNLIATYASGFTTTNVAAGLATLDEIQFTDVPLPQAITRVVRRAGAYWYPDYSKDIHAFETDAVNPPDTIDDASLANVRVHGLEYETDLTQLRTRVYCEGGGSTASVEIAVGLTSLPVNDASWYSATGGTVKISDQRITYTGRVLGGPGTTGGNVASSVAAPASAPTPSIASGIGGVLGAVTYKVSFATSSGETVAGPASSSVTGVVFTKPVSSGSAAPVSGIGRLAGSYSWKITFVTSEGETDLATSAASTTLTAYAAPSGAPSASAASGIGRLAGVYKYRVTFITQYGETTGGTESFTVTPVAFSVPNAPSIGLSGDYGYLIGTYNYKVTFVTQYGETTVSGAGNRTASAVAAPSAPGHSEISSTIGTLIGQFFYKVSFINGNGETLPGTASSGITLAAQSAPSAPSRSATGAVGALIGDYKWKVSFITDEGLEVMGSASTTLTVNAFVAATPSIGGDGTGLSIAYAVTFVAPGGGETARSNRAIDTNKGTNPIVTVNSLPSGYGWNVYSTGTSSSPSTDPLFKVAEMGAGTSSFTHTTETGPREGVVPIVGENVNLSSIPVGPTGTVARRIWRTKAGGSTYYLIGQIDNNSGTTFQDTTPDDGLTVQAPVSNILGKQVSVSSIATGPTGTVARRVYRTKAGGSQYFLLTQIDNNTTTSFTDNIPDTALSAGVPLVSTAGGEKHSVTVPTGPTGTLARRIYRTVAGGSEYKLLAELQDNSTTSYIDNIPDSALASQGPPLTSTAGGQNVSLSSIATGPTGTLSRRVYRTKASGSEYYLLTQFSDNVTSSFTDSTLDSELGGAQPPLNNTAGGENATLSTIPTGGTGTVARKVYRTKAGGSQYFLAGEIRDNSTTTFTDQKTDDELSSPAPQANDAGASIVSLASVPTGPAGITERRIYRTKGGGSQYFFVGQINNNTTTTFSDNNSDKELHDAEPQQSTLGVLAGSASINLVSAAAFPSSGWVTIGSQIIHYTGVSGSTLTGIPVTGVGSVGAGINPGTEVLNAPHLIGLPGAGAGSVLYLIKQGESVNVLAQQDDAAAQAIYGVIEQFISDERLSLASASTRALADLELFKSPITTIRYRTRDVKSVAGKTVTVNLGAPTNIVGTFKIQRVTVEDFIHAQGIGASRVVEASSVKFSFEDLVRRLETL